VKGGEEKTFWLSRNRDYKVLLSRSSENRLHEGAVRLHESARNADVGRSSSVTILRDQFSHMRFLIWVSPVGKGVDESFHGDSLETDGLKAPQWSIFEVFSIIYASSDHQVTAQAVTYN